MITRNGTMSSLALAFILAGILATGLFPAACCAQTGDSLKPKSEIEDLLSSVNQLNRQSLYDSALAVGLEALEKAENEYGRNDTTVANVLYVLGPLYRERKEWLKTLDCYERALKIIEAKYGEDDIRTYKYHYNLGHKNRILYRFDLAQKYLERALVSAWCFASSSGKTGHSFLLP